MLSRSIHKYIVIVFITILMTAWSRRGAETTAYFYGKQTTWPVPRMMRQAIAARVA